MSARLLARGLAAGFGVALACLGLLAGWQVLSWDALVVGLLLLATAVLDGWWPVGAAWRWLAGMLTAVSGILLWHLNLPALAARPPLVVGVAVSLAVLAVASLAAAHGPWAGRLVAALRGPRLAVLALAWLYVTVRWFTREELATRPGEVWHGWLPLVFTPLGTLGLIAAARQVPEAWLEAVAGWWRGQVAGHPRRVLAVLAVSSLAVTAHIAYRCVGPLPHVEDEIAYLYQAKTLLAGGLYQPAPPVPGAFDAGFAWIFMDDHGRSYGIFPPGWPLLLAAGARVGLPWLVNALLGVLVLLLTWRLLDRFADRPTAALTTALVAASPFFTLQGASFFAHQATLLWVLLGLLGALEAGAGRGARWALLAGLAVGMTLATRYVEGLLLGVTLAGYLAVLLSRRRVGLVVLLAAALGLVPGLGLALVDNAVKTGSPTQTPVERWFITHYGHALNRPGFGPDRGLKWDHSLGPGHTVVGGLWNTNANLFELNRYGFGWACGSLALAMLWLAFAGIGPIRRSRPIGPIDDDATTLDRLWLVYSALLLANYTAYWYHGIAFGPRFFHPLLVPLALWTVRGGRLVGGWLGRPHRVAAVAVLGVSLAWLAWVPLELLTTYHHARGRDAGDRVVVPMARALAGRPCVVIQAMTLRDGGFSSDYGIGFSLNPPGFRGDVLVARELDGDGRPQAEAIRRAYPDRVRFLWYKEGPTQRLVPLDRP